jgi:hypothetical protein
MGHVIVPVNDNEGDARPLQCSRQAVASSRNAAVVGPPTGMAEAPETASQTAVHLRRPGAQRPWAR